MTDTFNYPAKLLAPFFLLTAALLWVGCGGAEPEAPVANEAAEEEVESVASDDNPEAAFPHEGDDFKRTHKLTAHPDSSDWGELFEADLSEADFDPEVWKMEEGMLTAAEDRMIWTKKEYDEFILDLEFKNASGTNSGVILHVTDVKQWVPNSVEVQIADDFHEKWSSKNRTWQCAAIFGRKAATESLVKEPGQWNRMTILCEGPFIDVVLNGKLVNSMDMREWTLPRENPDGTAIPKWLNKPLSQHPSEGKIGFQGKHGDAPVWFRNVRIKEL